MTTNTLPATAHLDWLSDPKVFAVGRLSAHSDHIVYPDEASAKAGSASPLRQSLDGTWKFLSAISAAERPEGFHHHDFDRSGFGDITVPGAMQLQGHGRPQYVNTQYPWDGHEALALGKLPRPTGSATMRGLSSLTPPLPDSGSSSLSTVSRPPSMSG